MRKFLQGLGILLLAALVFAGVGLALAHRAIDRIEPPLPSPGSALSYDENDSFPIKIEWLNTASQKMPRSGVLQPGLDPNPDEPYVMSHSAFALTWPDGRIFLIDAGLDAASAPGFGAPIELLSGGDPIEFRASARDLLGERVSSLAGLAFTHLHADHTAGLTELCETLPGRLRLIQTRTQATELNFTTRGSHAQVSSAACARHEIIEGDAPQTVARFPGLLVLPAGGHTPGSTVFIAHVRTGDGMRSFVLLGDIVNHIDGLTWNLPKPHLYSRFVVPESTERLEKLRVFLRRLVTEHGAIPLVSHDENQLRAVFESLD
ncbi:MAG: MBL fold metallo-hydrolase [bacterium]|nr:MBL fold metallo-hydrolase [bacterium]